MAKPPRAGKQTATTGTGTGKRLTDDTAPYTLRAPGAHSVAPKPFDLDELDEQIEALKREDAAGPREPILGYDPLVASDQQARERAAQQEILRLKRRLAQLKHQQPQPQPQPQRDDDADDDDDDGLVDAHALARESASELLADDAEDLDALLQEARVYIVERHAGPGARGRGRPFADDDDLDDLDDEADEADEADDSDDDDDSDDSDEQPSPTPSRALARTARAPVTAGDEEEDEGDDEYGLRQVAPATPMPENEKLSGWLDLGVTDAPFKGRHWKLKIRMDPSLGFLQSAEQLQAEARRMKLRNAQRKAQGKPPLEARVSVEQLAHLLRDVVVAWNFVDRYGRPYPQPPFGLGELRGGVMAAVFNRVLYELNPKNTKSRTSKER